MADRLLFELWTHMLETIMLLVLKWLKVLSVENILVGRVMRRLKEEHNPYDALQVT